MEESNRMQSPPHMLPMMTSVTTSQRSQTASVMSAMIMGGGTAGAAGTAVAATKTNNKANKKPHRKKPSQRQPRPLVMVFPGQFGVITTPNINDVLSGRGGRINGHSGNIQYREMVQATKERYLDPSTKKLAKAHIAAEIVYAIRAMDPPGRFLTEQPNGQWVEIGDTRAFKKVGQALREDGPELRAGDGVEEINDDDDEDVGVEVDNEDKQQQPSPLSDKKITPLSVKKTPTKKAASVIKKPRGSPPPVEMIGTPTVSSSSNSATMMTTPTMSNTTMSRTTSNGSTTSPPPLSTTTSKRGGRLGQFTSAPMDAAFYRPTTSTSLSAAAAAFSQSNVIISGAAAQTLQDFEMPRITSTTFPTITTSVPQVPTATVSTNNVVVDSDKLFDRRFFPLPPINHNHSALAAERESSLLSGVSCPSAMSGVSQISGLTDPMSSISETAAAEAQALSRNFMSSTTNNNNRPPPPQQQYKPSAPLLQDDESLMSWMNLLDARSQGSSPPRRQQQQPPPSYRYDVATAPTPTTSIPTTSASVGSQTPAGDEMSLLSEQFNELYKDLEASSLPSVNGGAASAPRMFWEV